MRGPPLYRVGLVHRLTVLNRSPQTGGQALWALRRSLLIRAGIRVSWAVECGFPFTRESRPTPRLEFWRRYSNADRERQRLEAVVGKATPVREGAGGPCQGVRETPSSSRVRDERHSLLSDRS